MVSASKFLIRWYAILFWLLPFSCFGQNFLSTDTIRINEVVINKHRFADDLPGFRNIKLDSATLSENSFSPVSELLEGKLNISFRGYGAGGISTPSFRGTPASHTRVTWNGINISNPMLGQTDFSIIPSGLADDIRIYPGAASIQSGAGGFGGSLDIITLPQSKYINSFIISSGAGNYGRYSGMATAEFGKKELHSVSKIIFHSAENDFKYMNNINPAESTRERRKNGQVDQKVLLQEFYYRKNNHNLSARIWYQSASRNLALPIIVQQQSNSEYQWDESVRSMIAYDLTTGRLDYSATAAWINSALNYSNIPAGIESKNLTNTIVLKGRINARLGSNLKIGFLVDNESNSAETSNYSQKFIRNITSYTITTDYRPAGRFSTIMLFRELANNGKLLFPDFSAGFELKLTDQMNHFLKWNISRNTRIPSLNELYWNPGGNVNLKNESALGYELAYLFALELGQKLTIRTEAGIFQSYVKDLIHWHPGQDRFWVAENLRNVNITGIEGDVSVIYSGKASSLVIRANYSNTKSILRMTESRELDGMQLLYIPSNLGNVSARYSVKQYFCQVGSYFSGRRFIVADNSEFLAGYIVTDISTGIRLYSGGNTLNINLKVENLFNEAYESVPYYPQPGRTFHIIMSYKFTKK